MRAALPAGRLRPVCVGVRFTCVVIHFVYSAVPGDGQADSGHGPKTMQAEDRRLALLQCLLHRSVQCCQNEAEYFIMQSLMGNEA